MKTIKLDQELISMLNHVERFACDHKKCPNNFTVPEINKK